MNHSEIKRYLEQELKQRIFILDGGMGTMIQSYHLQEKDYRGERENGAEGSSVVLGRGRAGSRERTGLPPPQHHTPLQLRAGKPRAQKRGRTLSGSGLGVRVQKGSSSSRISPGA